MPICDCECLKLKCGERLELRRSRRDRDRETDCPKCGTESTCLHLTYIEVFQLRFSTLFLESPESRKLRDESEAHLVGGKQVGIGIHLVDGKPKYELESEGMN